MDTLSIYLSSFTFFRFLSPFIPVLRTERASMAFGNIQEQHPTQRQRKDTEFGRSGGRWPECDVTHDSPAVFQYQVLESRSMAAPRGSSR